jgi:hypothetical protein
MVAFNLFKELTNIEVQNALNLWLVKNIKCFFCYLKNSYHFKWRNNSEKNNYLL